MSRAAWEGKDCFLEAIIVLPRLPLPRVSSEVCVGGDPFIMAQVCCQSLLLCVAVRVSFNPFMLCLQNAAFVLDVMVPCLVLQAEEQGSLPSSLCLISMAIMNESSILKFGKDLDLAVHSFWIFLIVIPQGANLTQ